jgi:hypothetical protein
MPRPVPPEGRWDERHRLVSFYASDDIRTWIDEEMRRTGESKTQVIVRALEEQRRTPRSRGRRVVDLCRPGGPARDEDPRYYPRKLRQAVPICHL